VTLMGLKMVEMEVIQTWWWVHRSSVALVEEFTAVGLTKGRREDLVVYLIRVFLIHLGTMEVKVDTVQVQMFLVQVEERQVVRQLEETVHQILRGSELQVVTERFHFLRVYLVQVVLVVDLLHLLEMDMHMVAVAVGTMEEMVVEAVHSLTQHSMSHITHRYT